MSKKDYPDYVNTDFGLQKPVTVSDLITALLEMPQDAQISGRVLNETFPYRPYGLMMVTYDKDWEIVDLNIQTPVSNEVYWETHPDEA